MVRGGCIGLNGDPLGLRRPLDKLVEGRPQIDVFTLRREGLMVEGATWTVEMGHGGSLPAIRAPGKIILGDQAVPVRSHAALPVEVFGCPKCGRDCYRLHFVDGVWRCRTCPPRLKYRSQCRDRSVRGLSRVIYLRRRIGAELRPFTAIAPKRLQARRYWRLAHEIREIEKQLIERLRVGVGDVLEKRLDADRR